MFSEKYLIRTLDSYWAQWLPKLSKASLASMLKSHADQLVQSTWAEAMATATSAEYNDLIAEISFHSFARAMQTPKDDPQALQISPEDVHQAIEKMALIRGGKFDINAITPAMMDDALEITKRLFQVFRHHHADLKIHPRLKGYGRLASCYPDIVIADRLIEVKSSKYRFRVEDFKQVFLYAFLAHQNGQKINALELFNPRRSEKIVMKIDDFCMIFGQSNQGQIFDRIANDLK